MALIDLGTIVLAEPLPPVTYTGDLAVFRPYYSVFIPTPAISLPAALPPVTYTGDLAVFRPYYSVFIPTPAISTFVSGAQEVAETGPSFYWG